MELAYHCIDTSNFPDQMTAHDAIKILKNELWVVASSNTLFKAHYVQPSIVDFVLRQAESHPNRSSMQETFFHKLGTYFVSQLNERSPEEQYTFIPIHIENMLLAVEFSPLHLAQEICDRLAPFFELKGPVSRGQTMVQLFAMRVGIETGAIQIDPADYPSTKNSPSLKDK